MMSLSEYSSISPPSFACLDCITEYESMRRIATKSPKAVLLRASEIPLARSEAFWLGSASETAVKDRIRPTTVPRSPNRVAMFERE